MKSEIAERWTTALESGKYDQVRGALRKKNGYCCLGVLCEIAVSEGVIPPGTMRDGWYSYGSDGDRSPAQLPLSVSKWAGMRPGNTSGTYLSNYGDRSLTTDNDEDQKNFISIAGIIRQHQDEF